jgi:allantoinase
MNGKDLKRLSRVLMCLQDNQLQLVDIDYDSLIRDIRPRMDRPVSWQELDTLEKWHRFREQFAAEPQSQQNNVIDGQCLLVIPGAVDAHVHFNTPGYEVREDFEHGSLAAAAGGVTTVIDMPCTSVPPVTTHHNLLYKVKVLEKRSLVDYALWGGISGLSFANGANPADDIGELSREGVVGFKAYLVSGMETFPDLTHYQMLRAAEWVKKGGKILAVHAEDRNLVLERQAVLQKQGRNDWQAYIASRDILAETTAVSFLTEVCRSGGCRIHVVHLSSGQGAELVRRARQDGLPFTAETCPHYLYFTRDHFEDEAIHAFLKTAPPVKEESDRNALWNALQDGTISLVTTDHAGCNPAEEKQSKNFWEIYGGIPGVEHRVPFLFSEGFRKGWLSLQQIIALLAENPARLYGLSRRKGALRKKMDADMVLINLWKDGRIKAAEMHSKGKYTPFENYPLTAIVEKTFLRGEPVWDERNKPLQSYGYGHWIRAEAGIEGCI